MSDWHPTTLGEVANFNNGKSSPSRPDTGRYPVWGSNGIIGYANEINTPERSIVIGRVGSYCGSTYFSHEPCWVTENAIIGKSLDAISDTEFLYYFLSNFKLDRLRGGSGQPLINQSILNQIEIKLPSLSEQKDIAATLSCLDRKIENLRKQNETLEAIAQTLFKHWFVDFEFPNADGKPYKSSGGAMEPSELGEIPADWRVGKLGDIIVNYDRKRIPLSSSERDLRKGSYPYYGASSVMDYIDDYIFDGTYVLMGEDGTVIDDRGFPILQYVFGKFWANNHAHVLQGKSFYSTNTLYLLLKRTRINNIVTGAVQPKINQANMNSIDLVIADEKTLLKLDSVISPIFEKTKINVKHMQTLKKNRDLLLPKLMSGKLRVTL
jgi:restriction endonuclease S subunit